MSTFYSQGLEAVRAGLAEMERAVEDSQRESDKKHALLAGELSKSIQTNAVLAKELSETLENLQALDSKLVQARADYAAQIKVLEDKAVQATAEHASQVTELEGKLASADAKIKELEEQEASTRPHKIPKVNKSAPPNTTYDWYQKLPPGGFAGE